MELCQVPPGQLARKHISQDQTNDILQFATMNPRARKQSVENGLGVCLVLCACRPADNERSTRCFNTANRNTSNNSAWTFQIPL